LIRAAKRPTGYAPRTTPCVPLSGTTCRQFYPQICAHIPIPSFPKAFSIVCLSRRTPCGLEGGPQMQPDDMDEATRQRAEQLGFKVEMREDGWYLTGELQEEVGAFSEIGQVRAFLDWLETMRHGQ
jgi:hypothetical protein